MPYRVACQRGRTWQDSLEGSTTRERTVYPEDDCKKCEKLCTLLLLFAICQRQISPCPCSMSRNSKDGEIKVRKVVGHVWMKRREGV